MSQLLPVVWSKGVFLSPQHLQAQDRYFEDLLNFQVRALTQFGWGFSEVQIDGTALATGTLTLSRAAGLFPDNLSFEMPEADPLPPSRNIEDCFRDGAQRRMFYLAVPERRPAGLNVSGQRGGLSTRFFTEAQLLRDENSTGTGASAERTILLARKNVQILAEGENTAGSVLLPLIAIQRTEAGLYRPDPNYCPPVVNLHASPLLTGILRGLLELLVARAAQLGGARRQRNESLADFSASDVANFWLLYTMNTELPELRHLLETSLVHPEILFRAMLRLAGTLTTFSPKFELRDLPRYDHEQLGSCFGLLDALLRELLETVVPSNFVAFPLKLVRPSVYATTIDKDRYFENSRFYLAVTANLREPELINRFSKLAKVASATHIENYIRQALPGLRMVHVPVPPRAIPVKLQYQYFSLERAGDVWEAITRARNLAVYASDEINDPQMELIILLAAPE